MVTFSRQVLIARSIAYTILTTLPNGEPAHDPSLVIKALRFLRLFYLVFRLFRADVFHELREVWQITEDQYRVSFGAEPTQKIDGSGDGRVINSGDNSGNKNKKKDKKKNKKQKDVLQSMGDMGYSGSTFFTTSDGAYLVKSVPRHFEHDFFKHELLTPYAGHMKRHPESLLIRITDLLERTHKSLGEFLGLAPSHHIVMENILYGREEGETQKKQKWETWDLKPTSYFFPERDVAGGYLASEATKSRLADKFDDKLRLSRRDAARFREMLEIDTRLLCDNNAVDYSLFLVRISSPSSSARNNDNNTNTKNNNNNNNQPASETQPLLGPGHLRRQEGEGEGGEGVRDLLQNSTNAPQPPPSPTWRTGILSSDGKEVYRAAILDFFWAKHTLRAKLMTGLVRSYNLIDEQGPMSITAESDEYRQRFLEMCEGFVEVDDEGDDDDGSGGE